MASSPAGHILIIEDNEEVRENLSEILELYGYRTTTAADGLAGAKRAIAEPPDLILCDVMMPELDGFGVLNLLSENPLTATIPFVFITARTETEDIRRGMNLGADDYITKPFYKDELLQVVRTRLRKAAGRQGGAPNAQAAPARLSDPDRGRALLEQAFDEEGSQRSYDPGSTVVREGDYPHFVYRLRSGRVHLSRSHDYGRDYILTELGPDEWFGMPSVLEQSNFHFTARVATEPVVLQQLPRATFLELVRREHTVADTILQLMAGKLVHRSGQLVNQAYDSVRRRTALLLCDLYDRHPDEPLVLSREELAQMVGTTKETVIRTLSEFRRDGLLQVEGKRIRLIAPEVLRNLSV